MRFDPEDIVLNHGRLVGLGDLSIDLNASEVTSLPAVSTGRTDAIRPNDVFEYSWPEASDSVNVIASGTNRNIRTIHMTPDDWYVEVINGRVRIKVTLGEFNIPEEVCTTGALVPFNRAIDTGDYVDVRITLCRGCQHYYAMRKNHDPKLYIMPEGYSNNEFKIWTPHRAEVNINRFSRVISDAIRVINLGELFPIGVSLEEVDGGFRGGRIPHDISIHGR